MTSQDVADRFITDRVAQFGKFTCNPVIAPIMILLRKPNNETFKLSIDSWPAAATIGIVRPFASHQLAVPTKDGLRLEDSNDSDEAARWCGCWMISVWL